ncbi:OLC1v1008701C1 [Oldenlandia corymbosa var. corymbosa]|uniref:OLC1v1008701C1 n=1 Tax=Oldenlandia corymbosa var. corymbosa TaxID=529605 RepID=A0AAV1DMR8_OLDCO|nr:OLC1v1008701C1 [Oldenlandia corymbosa var. corymbosa]
MTRSNPLGELSFDPEIKDTTRRSKFLRNRKAAAQVPKEDQKKMAEVAAADQPQERELQPAQSRLLRDYFVPQEEEVQTPLVYNDVAAENFDLKTQLIQWKEPRATTKKAVVLELDTTTHLQAQMAAITSELSKFMRQGDNRGGFINYNNWRPQQNNNWTNQQSNYQRSAQPPGFQNQPFRVKEEDWIKVGNVLGSLDATVKDMQNQEAAKFFRRNWERQAIVERGMVGQPDPNSYIALHHWKGLCNVIIRPNLSAVREFYSNLRGAPRDEITVKGQVVNISIEAIREVLHLLETDFNYADGAYQAMDDPSKDEFPYVLCSGSAEVKWTKCNGLRKHFPASNLKPEYRQWYNMICTNIMPMMHKKGSL